MFEKSGLVSSERKKNFFFIINFFKIKDKYSLIFVKDVIK